MDKKITSLKAHSYYQRQKWWDISDKEDTVEDFKSVFLISTSLNGRILKDHHRGRSNGYETLF